MVGSEERILVQSEADKKSEIQITSRLCAEEKDRGDCDV